MSYTRSQLLTKAVAVTAVFAAFLAMGLPASAQEVAEDDGSLAIESEMAAPIPILTIGTPLRAGPGETLTLRGQGFPADEEFQATLHESGQIDGAGGYMATFSSDGNGKFAIESQVPEMLSGRETLFVLPGSYTMKVSPLASTVLTAPIGVGAPRQGTLIWGDLTLGAGQRSDLPADVAGISVAGVAGVGLGTEVGITSTDGNQMLSEQETIVTDDRGRFMFWVPAGGYSLNAATSFGGLLWRAQADIQAGEGEVQSFRLLLEPVS